MKQIRNKILITSIIILTFCIVLFIIITNKKDNKTTVKDINNKYYDISFNLKNKTAIVDGKKTKISELLNISDSKLDNMIDSNKFSKYLSNNLLGNITVENQKIEVTNPYSLNKLIVKTNNKKELQKDKNVIRIKNITDNIYQVSYKNSVKTKQAYESLENNKKIDDVVLDAKVKKMEDKVTSKANNTIYYAWGVSSTALDLYSKKLNQDGNSNNIRVAVMDTGVRKNHDVFNLNTPTCRIDLTDSYDYVNNDSNPNDDEGHGTTVAGTLAESTSNNVRIVPIKVLDNTGSGDLSDILIALDDIKGKVNIINLSLGIKESKLDAETREEAELIFKSIYNNTNTIVVAAAGNDSSRVNYPGSSNYTYAASSVDKSNNFSSSFSNYGDQVDFATPGEDLILPYNYGNSYYRTVSGTSFSSPFLAAAIASIKSENPTYNRYNIVNELKENAKDLGTPGKDKYYGWGSINFEIKKFFKPTITNLEVSNKWDITNTLKVKATTNGEASYYAITNSSEEPTNWNTIGNYSKEINIEEEINENGNYYIWIKNNNRTTNKKFTVDHIDKQKPVIINQISSLKTTNSKIKVSLKTQDNISGISKIKWYYKKEYSSYYISVTDTYNTEDTSILEKTHKFTNLAANTKYIIYAEVYDMAGNYIGTNNYEVITKEFDEEPHIEYQTHIQKIGWQNKVEDGEISGTSGQALRLEGIKINLFNMNNYSGSIKYQTHIQKIGWQNYANEGELSGTTGKGLRLEAIRIKLTGDIADDYDIYYRVHVQNFGWLDWAKNGESAGTSSYSYRLEAIQIQLVEKDENAPGSTLEPYRTKMLNYSSYIQSKNWQKTVTDKQTSGTTGKGLRLEALKIKLIDNEYSGSIRYKAHIQKLGWQNYASNWSLAGTTGTGLRMEAIKIKLTGDISNRYDVYYRTHVQKLGWLGWAKNDEISGTTGYGYRTEAIQIQLVRKGKTFSGSTKNTYKSK